MDVNSLPPVSTRMSASEFLELPEDGKRYELLSGDVYVTPSPLVIHQSVLLRLARSLDEFLTESGRGVVYVAPLDVVLDSSNVVQPDVFVVLTAHAYRLTTANIQGAPDLVVEVLSPSNALRDRNLKLSAYASASVPEAWLVDCERRSIDVFRLREDGRYALVATVDSTGAVDTPLLPGLVIEVRRLFE